MFDSKFKDFQGKFQTHWLGPYEIVEIFDNEAFVVTFLFEDIFTRFGVPREIFYRSRSSIYIKASGTNDGEIQNQA